MSDEAHRLALRRFIAERAPRLRFAEGMRVPRSADEEAAIRAWLRALYGRMLGPKRVEPFWEVILWQKSSEDFKGKVLLSFWTAGG